MTVQERLIEYENSYLFEGGECTVFPEDDHALHIEEHDGVGGNTKRHIEDHKKFLESTMNALEMLEQLHTVPRSNEFECPGCGTPLEEVTEGTMPCEECGYRGPGE